MKAAGQGIAILILWAVALTACDLPPGPVPTPVPAATAGPSAAGTIARAAATETPGAPAPAPSAAGQGGCSPTAWGPTTTDPVDDAPVRAAVGTGHVLQGTVRASPDCAPLPGAAIIFWLAGPNGHYDDAHRAKVFTDSAGHYRFESNYPGRYPERPVPHIHLYVAAAGYRSVELEYQPAAGQTAGTLDVVLAPAPSDAPPTAHSP